MFLSKITLNASHPQARKDLSSAYEMHRTLSRVFAVCDNTPPARFLWRQEVTRSWDASEVDLLVQATVPGQWGVLQHWPGYVAREQADKAVDLQTLVREGAHYRFRLRANPTVTRSGKRYGLKAEADQHAWLVRQGQRLGFDVLACERSGSDQLSARQPRAGGIITVQAVTFDGVLAATDEAALRAALVSGVGHAKALGLGLLSLAPIAGK